MIASIKALDPGLPLRQVLFYRAIYWPVLALFTLIYRARFFGVQNIPRSGGVLIVANHQSHLDPPLLGVAIRHRNMAAIAREGLYRNPLFGALLRGLGTIPIKEKEGDAGAMRAAIAQLKADRVVVIFPEGSRSPDGAMYSFKRGSWLLLAKSQIPVVPAAVEGCYDAWPRGTVFPRLIGQRVAVAFGEPIPFAELKALGADAALDRLAREVDALRLDLRSTLRRHSRGHVPAEGEGDRPFEPRPMPERSTT
jgi:1-acyl-sn-glycerol-3-phosphate acyltransferase